jgi:5-methylcytosine-specific restriction endonuclease McrA
MNSKTCIKCGRTFPETREFFGQYKNERQGIVRIGFRNSCRECMSTHTKEYDSRNAASVRARIERRQMRLAGDEGINRSDIARLKRVLGDKCRYCGDPLNGSGEVDHLTPVARGGTNNIGNLTLACRPCNLSKTSKTLDEYVFWRRERDLPVRRIQIQGECPDPVIRQRLRGRYPI